MQFKNLGSAIDNDKTFWVEAEQPHHLLQLTKDKAILRSLYETHTFRQNTNMHTHPATTENSLLNT